MSYNYQLPAWYVNSRTSQAPTRKPSPPKPRSRDYKNSTWSYHAGESEPYEWSPFGLGIPKVLWKRPEIRLE